MAPSASATSRSRGLAAAPRRFASGDIDVRVLRTHREYHGCVELQKETWGRHFNELVPATILMVSQRIGGVSAGAFDAEGALLGFVFGMTGVEDGQLVHWSDMLAVRESARNRGIGRRLKEFQRSYLRDLGVESVYWTFDPLVARNAHLNLNRLGARVVEYVPNMYGDTRSSLNRGLGTDRLVVIWEIGGAGGRNLQPVHPAEVENTPVANTAVGAGRPPPEGGAAGGEQAVVRIEIPRDVQAIPPESVEENEHWRAVTRRAFLHYLDGGYRVRGFYGEGNSGPCFYVLSRSAMPTRDGSDAAG
jgi:predicted GNAT superfamily acetyltransferase